MNVVDLKIEYQRSNGTWDDARNPDAAITECMNNNGLDEQGQIVTAFSAVRLLTREEVINALTRGIVLRNDPEDWYSNTRSGSYVETILAKHAAYTAAHPVKMVKCSCGHTIEHNLVMSASLGTSCPDCYDDMS